jgi:hypothetical protein
MTSFILEPFWFEMTQYLPPTNSVMARTPAGHDKQVCDSIQPKTALK